jgi:hypothetical protein
MKGLGLPLAALEQPLTQEGRAAGRPWGMDQRESYLAALVALAA